MGFLRGLYDVAVEAAQPHKRMLAYMPSPPAGRTIVLGAGKAAAAMAQAFDFLYPADVPLQGLVVTRYGHTPPSASGRVPRIQIVEAGHPVPDQMSYQAGQQIRALIQTAHLQAEDQVVFLISGGGSALLCDPVDGLSFVDKVQMTKQLLASGAPIGSMNILRKHTSRLKGGQLAVLCQPARMLSLLISDVPGDMPSEIASGPSVPDPSTVAQALAIQEQYGITLPSSLLERWREGSGETPKFGHSAFHEHPCYLIATPQQSLEAAAMFAKERGVRAYILSDAIEGESIDMGRAHAAIALSTARGKGAFRPPCVILSGGETTVTLRGGQPDPSARGGRAGEFCLGLAEGLAGHTRIHGLAADTDGIDGSGDNAGAMVFPDTLQRAQQRGDDIRRFIARHDAYGYFANLGDLLMTGPTHTNVNDFRALLVL